MSPDESLSFGDKLADRIAKFGGSWWAIIVCVSIIIVWIIVNTWGLLAPVDPYPYILLNLVLSCVAALQAPFILMAANRQQIKDSARLEEDLAIDKRSEQTINLLLERIQKVQAQLDQM
jgi:uncharacterized membrane protein